MAMRIVSWRRRSSLSSLRRWATCGLVLLAVLVQSDAAQAQAPAAIEYFDQGWSAAERTTFYFTSQGSHLFPYDWFVQLEQAGNDRPFKDDANMERFGFLPHQKVTGNKDALPIGFVMDDVTTRNRPNVNFVEQAAQAKQSYLGGELARDRNLTEKWVGLTCAACHTSNLQFGGKTYRIDGGQATADFETFLDELVEALDATIKDDEKMTRFAKRVVTPGGQFNVERAALLRSMKEFMPKLRQSALRGKGTTPFGYGRLDAFGAILNEVCETSLEIPANHHPADAPASFPVLWDVSHLEWVQWNSSIGNPIARNVGEVLGVFAQSRLKGDPTELFTSTAHISNLHLLEKLYVAKLQAPKWPATFGEPDAALVAAGKELYAKTCIDCHKVRDNDGNFPMVSIGGGKFIVTVQSPLSEIRTDPQLAVNFVTRTADPGALRPFLLPPMPSAPQVPRALLLKAAVRNVIGRYVKENNVPPNVLADMINLRPPNEETPNLLGYKGRPLNGIWASAPFLHNGSVPTLYDLLLPESERPKHFHVGSREFDRENVGFVSTPDPKAFAFHVVDEMGMPIPGNRNTGHSGEHYTQYKPSDGEPLRNFTVDERRAIIEYVKTLY